MAERAQKTINVGLLDRGTVGGAFARLVAERAPWIAALTGREPRVSGVLTRGEGDFDEILEHADVIVELICLLYTSDAADE